MKRVTRVGVAILLLAGCDGGYDAPSSQKAKSATWQALPDGSHYSELNGDSVSDAARCWTTNGAAAECIEVSVVRLPGMGATTTVQATTRSALGSDFRSDAGLARSYKCSHSDAIGLEEEISLAGNKLASRARSFEGRWPKPFVVAYLKDNKLRGRYFDCVGVMDALSRGSLATLRTTSITRAMLQ